MQKEQPGGQSAVRCSPSIYVRSLLHVNSFGLLTLSLVDTLNLHIQPSDVRLKPIFNETPYEWEIVDASLTPIFEKHLSKHSVGVYIQLCNGLGQKFRAIYPGRVSHPGKLSHT